MEFNYNRLTFNEQGLVPVVVQEIETNEVLMLAYMNKDAIEQTLITKVAHYFSRSRQSLWKKGETSGNYQYVEQFSYDCDADTILLKVKQMGVACHTGKNNCFFNHVNLNDLTVSQYDASLQLEEQNQKPTPNILSELYKLIDYRKLNPTEGSYTTYLFTEGIDKILKKVGEETSEVIIGAKNNDKDELIYEISDLVYHVLVLMVEQGVTLSNLKDELRKRRN